MAEYNASILFPQESGIVESLQNDLTLRASSSGDVIVSPNTLRPEINAGEGDNAPGQDLGSLFLRWKDLYLRSINTTGSIKPESKWLGDLGSQTEEWGAVYAASGRFTDVNVASNLTAGFVSADSVEVATSFELLGGAVSIWSGDINIFGVTSIRNETFAPDVSGTRGIGTAGLGITNLRPFGRIAGNSGYFHKLFALPGDDDDLQVCSHLIATKDLGVEGEAEFSGISNFDATAATQRPTINGSGIALVNETSPNWETLYLIEPATVGFSENAYKGGDVDITSFNYAFISEAVAERCRLSPKFSVTSTSALGSTDEWQFVIRKRATGNATPTHIGSGWFSWNGAGSVPQVTTGILEFDSESDLIFEAGESFNIAIHNDGSGVTVNTPIIRGRFGFHTFPEASGQGI